MYKIYADDILIYDDTSSDPFFKVVSPKLTMEVNAAGSLSLTIPPGNAGYDTISLMTTDISVEKDGKEIWFGRVLQEEKDFLNNRALTCEGALAFLNDTTQQQGTYDVAGQTGIMMLLETFLNEHNSHVPDDRKIYFERGLDVVTVSYNDELDCEVNYETTIECINKFILEKTKGYLIVSRKLSQQYGSSLHVDYYDPESMARTNTQTIEFGKNLMDFTKSLDSADFATVIVPLGAKSGEEGQEQYLTVEDVTTRDSSDPCSGRFVGTQTGIDSYGWIERVVHFDDCDNADTLYRLARNYLAETQYNTMEISLSALDLHYLNPEIMAVDLGDKLHVMSPPHGLDGTFTVLKLDIPMDQPQNTAFQLGDTIKVSLTSSTRKVNTELLEQISSVSLDKDEILEAAKANATAIMNQKTNGFITITSEEPYGTNELYVSESIPVFNPNFNPDEPESESNRRYSAKNFWKWNANGLGYTDNYGFDYKATITKDGTIIGERIAAGSIHGSKITAGTLDIVTSAGQTGLSIGLSARGMAPGSFVVGDIDQNGQNAAATNRARSILKTYLTATTKVTLNSTSYWFEPMEYSDDNDPESGFVRGWGEPADRIFTVQSTNYYRFVVRKTGGGTISTSELNAIAAAFDLSGSSAVIRAQDLHVIGMVTLSDVSEAGSTIINGANIMTGTVTAQKIDIRGLTVRNDDDDITFSVSNTGDVYVNGNIDLSENSMISFSGQSDKRLGDVALDAEDALYASEALAAIAEGTYTGTTIGGVTYTGTFINGRTIFSPTIIANNLIAKAPSGSTGTSGVIALQDANGNDKLSMTYRSQVDAAPGVYFSTNTTGVYSFDMPIEVQGGITLGLTSSSNLPYSYIHGKVFMNSDSEIHFGGDLILEYGVNYVSSYDDLPDNAQTGQICFVLN